jgi:hypothetical protein
MLRPVYLKNAIIIFHSLFLQLRVTGANFFKKRLTVAMLKMKSHVWAAGWTCLIQPSQENKEREAETDLQCHQKNWSPQKL